MRRIIHGEIDDLIATLHWIKCTIRFQMATWQKRMK